AFAPCVYVIERASRLQNDAGCSLLKKETISLTQTVQMGKLLLDGYVINLALVSFADELTRINYRHFMPFFLNFWTQNYSLKSPVNRGFLGVLLRFCLFYRFSKPVLALKYA